MEIFKPSNNEGAFLWTNQVMQVWILNGCILYCLGRNKNKFDGSIAVGCKQWKLGGVHDIKQIRFRNTHSSLLVVKFFY